jgi:hypothetical protein
LGNPNFQFSWSDALYQANENLAKIQQMAENYHIPIISPGITQRFLFLPLNRNPRALIRVSANYITPLD